MHNCAATPCPVQVPAHILMCRAHWYQVPPPLRAEVNKTWREYNKAATSNAARERFSAAGRAYLAARKAAVVAVTDDPKEG